MNKISRFLAAAARVAKRKNLSIVFTWSDLGNFFHVYGCRATPAQFVASMVRLGKASKKEAVA